MKPGPKNLITDIAGLKVGNAADARLKSGVTVLVGEAPFVASVDVMGGAPGTRETDLLQPDRSVEKIDALVLSGGSVFGLNASSAVADELRAAGRGIDVGGMRVPIVPAAILFDLANGGDKQWDENPYGALGAAALAAAGETFEIGTEGAGFGATTAGLKGGLGSASLVLPSGVTVGALAAANPVGQVVVGGGGNFWASSFEIDAEFGGRGAARAPVEVAQTFTVKRDRLAEAGNTVLAIVATDATLTKAECKRVAVAAQDGIGRAVVPAHTPLDGDLVFAAATGRVPRGREPLNAALEIGHAASVCVSRAIARAVYEARTEPGDLFDTYQHRFGR
jgi:L-aminopeptidase/D-esterase-like protein